MQRELVTGGEIGGGGGRGGAAYTGWLTDLQPLLISLSLNLTTFIIQIIQVSNKQLTG